jgi:hypothetical protein
VAKTVRYGNRKADILRVLMERAKHGERITYGNLGKRIGGIPATGPWKEVLDDLSRDERAAGRPDIIYLVVSSKTGYPSQIDFKDSRVPTAVQKARADVLTTEIFAFYAAL